MCVRVLGGKVCYLVPWFPAPSWEPDWKKRHGCDCGFIVFVSWCCHVSFSAMDLDNYFIFQPFTCFQVCRHRMVDTGGQV